MLMRIKLIIKGDIKTFRIVEMRPDFTLSEIDPNFDHKCIKKTSFGP